jgi:hypothetical protein
MWLLFLVASWHVDRAWLRSLVHTSCGPCRSGPKEGQVSFLGAASLTCLLSQSSIITDLSSSLGFRCSDFAGHRISSSSLSDFVARIWSSLGFRRLLDFRRSDFVTQIFVARISPLGFRHSDFCRSLGFHCRHLCTSLWYATVCIAIDCDFAGTISNYQLFFEISLSFFTLDFSGLCHKGFSDFTVWLDFAISLDFAIMCQVPRLVRAPVYCCMSLPLPCPLSSYRATQQ